MLTTAISSSNADDGCTTGICNLASALEVPPFKLTSDGETRQNFSASADVEAAAMKAILWDECLSMDNKSVNPLGNAQHRVEGSLQYMKYKSQWDVLSYVERNVQDVYLDNPTNVISPAAITAAVEQLLSNCSAPKLAVTLGAAFAHPDLHIDVRMGLQKLGFAPTPKEEILGLHSKMFLERFKAEIETLKVRTATPSATSGGSEPLKHPVIDEVQIVRVTTPEGFAQRRAIEGDIFGYNDAHRRRLAPALEMMRPRDYDYLAFIPTESEPVAYMTFRLGHGVAYLQGAAVRKPYRRFGIARAMTHRGIKDVAERGYDVVVLAADGGIADQTWRSLGFRNFCTYECWTRESQLRTDVVSSD